MVLSESLETTNLISGAIEAPRYSCALAGAYATAVMQVARIPEDLMEEQVPPVLL